MKKIKIFICTLCTLLILGTSNVSSFASTDGYDLDLENKETLTSTFLEEKDALLKLPGVTVDKEGNVIIPMKMNKEITITLPSGQNVTYGLKSEQSLTRAASKSLTVYKSYFAGPLIDSAVNATVAVTANCNWANRSVTINRSYHDVSGRNPYGIVTVGNKENTIIKKSGDTATAEAAGDITFTFTTKYTDTKLVPYRIQIIVDAADSNSASIKVLR